LASGKVGIGIANVADKVPSELTAIGIGLVINVPAGVVPSL
jgi:hypothetical protein